MDPSASQSPITGLLLRWTAGEAGCRDELAPLVERELHLIAHRHMRKERDGHTLQTTALVNEAWLQLVDQSRANWHNRAHFFAVAAGLMRRILVDSARRRCRLKRGSGAGHLPIDEELVFVKSKSAALVALDDALQAFAQQYPRKAQVVELRYFGGLEVREVAKVLGLHTNTVIRDWGFAKGWLKRELNLERDTDAS